MASKYVSKVNYVRVVERKAITKKKKNDSTDRAG